MGEGWQDETRIPIKEVERDAQTQAGSSSGRGGGGASDVDSGAGGNTTKSLDTDGSRASS